MTRLKDLYEYLDYLDNCSDGQFLKFLDAMEKRGYKFVTQYVHDYDYPYVTHCKDCKHCMIFSIYKTKWYVCTRNVESIDVKAEDFCSYAERGNDETD